MNEERRGQRGTNLSDASLTLTLGLCRSSLRRELCSVSRRSLSSLTDCLWFLDDIKSRGEDVGRRRGS